MSLQFLSIKDFNAQDIQNAVDELSAIVNDFEKHVTQGDFAYSGGNPAQTAKVLANKKMTAKDLFTCLFLFFERGNNVTKMIVKTNGPGKTIIDALVKKYNIVNNANGVLDLTLSRIAAAALPAWPALLGLSSLQFNLLGLDLKARGKPYHWLSVPGIAGAIPKHNDYDILMHAMELYQLKIHQIIGNKTMKPMQVPVVARAGNYLDDSARKAILQLLGILDANDLIEPVVLNYINNDMAAEFQQSIDHARNTGLTVVYVGALL